MSAGPATDRIYLRGPHWRALDATVVAVDEDGRVALDAMTLYATGGGQPHATGSLAWECGSAAVVDVGVTARWCGRRWRVMCRR